MATVGPFSVASALIISGPGVKKGSRAVTPVDLNDIAPTMSHLLGISPPAQTDGRILYEALEDTHELR
jgi:arylsulfatase A-like enzyme